METHASQDRVSAHQDQRLAWKIRTVIGLAFGSAVLAFAGWFLFAHAQKQAEPARSGRSRLAWIPARIGDNRAHAAPGGLQGRSRPETKENRA